MFVKHHISGRLLKNIGWMYGLLFILSILIQSCFPKEDLKIEGRWKFPDTDIDKMISPFRSFCSTSYPELFPCYEVVYIDENQIEHPLIIGKDSFRLADKYIEYEIIGDTIMLTKDSVSYLYDWKISGDKLCFNRGEFCLERDKNTLTKLDSTIFNFKVVQEDRPSYTFWLNYHYRQESNTCEIIYDMPCEPNEQLNVAMPESEMSYIVSLLERIPDEQLNRIYNNGLSDCTEISIDFYTAEEYWKGIETCGLTNENPFEIRALTTNMLAIIDKYLRE